MRTCRTSREELRISICRHAWDHLRRADGDQQVVGPGLAFVENIGTAHMRCKRQREKDCRQRHCRKDRRGRPFHL